MARGVKLNELDTVLSDLNYPLSRDEVIEERGDVTLVLADGEENLGELLSQSNEDEFDSEDELTNELLSLLPQHAVGEPYQSEGEG